MRYSLNLPAEAALRRIDQALRGPIADMRPLHRPFGWEPGLYGEVWGDRFELGVHDYWLSPHRLYRLFPMRLHGQVHSTDSGCEIETSFPVSWRCWAVLALILLLDLAILLGWTEGPTAVKIAVFVLSLCAVIGGAIYFRRARARNNEALEHILLFRK